MVSSKKSFKNIGTNLWFQKLQDVSICSECLDHRN